MPKTQREKKKLQRVAELGERLKNRLAFYTCLFMLAVFCIHPFMIGPQGYANITEVKLYTFVTILCAGLFLFACAFGYALIQGHVPVMRVKERLKSVYPHEWALIGYWIILFISSCASEYPQYAFYGSTARNEGFWMQSAYLAAFFIVGRFYRPKPRDLLIFCGAASVIALHGTLQYYGIDPVNVFPEGAQGIGPYMTYFSTMSNKNMVSTYLCFAVCIATVLFIQYEKPIRFAFLPMSWICFYMLLLGDTESGYVALVAVLLMGLPFIAKDRRCMALLLFQLACFVMLGWVYGKAFFALMDYEAPMWAILSKAPYAALGLFVVAAALFFIRIPELPVKLYRIGWFAIVLVIVIVGLSSLPLLAEITGVQTFNEAAEIFSGNVPDSLGSNRGFIWKRALTLVPERPLIGYGPDNFFVAFYARFNEEAVERNGVSFDKAHNEYIQTLVDSGILGLLALVAFFALTLFAALKYIRDPIVAALTAAVFTFLVQAFFNFSTPFAHPHAWIMWGILSALIRRHKKEAALPPPNN